MILSVFLTNEMNPMFATVFLESHTLISVFQLLKSQDLHSLILYHLKKHPTDLK